MSVSAVLVTRGDVSLGPVLDSLPPEWEKIVWDNGNGGNPASVGVRVKDDDGVWVPDFTRHSYVTDLGVYGRYAGAEYASHYLIFVQDDDVIVSDPQAIVDEWVRVHGKALLWEPELSNHLVANMPQEFRHDGYTDSCLVGFGACFHRDAPARAFDRYCARFYPDFGPSGADHWRLPRVVDANMDDGHFLRTCDVVFTTLTPRVLVDVPKVNREFAEDEGRMYRQPGHVEERQRMLELARRCRDGR